MQTFHPAGLRAHAAFDMLLVAFGFASPWLFGYADQPLPFWYTLAAAGFGLGLNLVTNYPAGVLRLLPVSWHRFIEWTSPAPFILGPWLLFPGTSTAWALTAIGVAIVLNTLLIRAAHPAPAAG